MGPVILFDGVCNFCNAWVNFVIRRDRRAVFRFAPLQSEAAVEMLQSAGIDPLGIDSVIVLEDGRVHTFSDAALKITEGLGGFWRSMSVFRIVPRGIRDAVYRLIARNRYKWFGKKDVCMIPSAAVRTRFLSSTGENKERREEGNET